MDTPAILITEYGDPACPWGYANEGARLRLQWLYGDALSWELHLVGLTETPQDYLDKGFTPERLEPLIDGMADRFGLPFTARKERMLGTQAACLAVAAVGVHRPELERRYMRQLQIAFHSYGALIDEVSVQQQAAAAIGLDADEFTSWLEGPAAAERLKAGMAAARNPSPAALALSHKLAPWGKDGHRYTCPSLTFTHAASGDVLSLPGFQSIEAYEVAIANLDPSLSRRDDPESATDVLRWAGMDLATAEIAAVWGKSVDDVRAELDGEATWHEAGTDGYWSLATAGAASH